MKRRNFIRTVSTGLAASVSGCNYIFEEQDEKIIVPTTRLDSGSITVFEDGGDLTAVGDQPLLPPTIQEETLPTQNVKKRIIKSQYYNKDFNDDIFIDRHQIRYLKSTHQKLTQIKKYLGFGHFNLVSFDEAIKFSKRYSKIQAFTKQELDFLDQIFHTNAQAYGFFGDKVIPDMTSVISKRDTKKIPYTGHFLYRGEALALYSKIRREIGQGIILTSGIRGVIKQMHLFLTKTIVVGGNLSRASRSLAPPGHSYHGIGDFDVGKVGFGTRRS